MQTAIENITPVFVRERLEQLKIEVSAITTAEAALLKTKAERLSALRREAAKHTESETQRLDVRVHSLAENHKERVGGAHVQMELRLARIQQAYHSSKAALARRVQESRDQRIGKVQGTIMRNRQQRQHDLDQATADHTAFIETLTADRVERQEIRKKVYSSLRTFRPWINGWYDGSRGKFPSVETPATAEKTRGILLETLQSARADADAASRLPLVKLFRCVPLWSLSIVLLLVAASIALRDGHDGFLKVMPALVMAEAVLVILWGIALFSALPIIRSSAFSLAKARGLEAAAANQSNAQLAALNDEIRDEKELEGRNLSDTFRETEDEWRNRMNQGQRELDQRHARLPEKLNQLHQRHLDKLAAIYEYEVRQVRDDSLERMRIFEAEQNQLKANIESDTADEIAKLVTTWQDKVLPAIADLQQLDDDSKMQFPAWTESVCENWSPPEVAPEAVRIGSMEVNLSKLTGGLPSDGSFIRPVAEIIKAPFTLAFPSAGSLMVETDGPDDGAGARILNAAVLRVLASHPPGRAAFVFIDPVGLGKDFAGLMHLADYEETLINHRIWTQTTHIEERLAEINEHIEKVIQMYLRDEYVDINAYNQQAGTTAEKYRFVVIAGFPAAFSDTAAKRLRSIASSGARCGVHLLIQRDVRQPFPDSALDDELRRLCQILVLKNDNCHLTGALTGAESILIDPAPSHRDSIALVHRIGRASVDSNRVQVPFAQIAPTADEEWTLDTSEELRVPIGRTGAKKLQMLAIGKGTKQHVLVAGKTGSGKSTLFHVIITNLALWCSPEQVEFYLVDFKKGVEFKCYAAKHLPHARVVAIESDREFALSVLQRVDAELKRRGELFRKAGSQDVAGYKRTLGALPMPRSLLLIDEFQEFFTEDDAVAQEASLLLDRIVRQGRAFGIHVILGSQTLGGAYTLARATLGQMVIRIALQCNETDAHLIMDDDNPAPRLLTRPGEGIYNDQAGALAANSPFQIVWLPEDDRDDVLDRVHAKTVASHHAVNVPIVFEGNAPADIRDNADFSKLLIARPSVVPKKSHAWLGAPNSIKGPTEAVFQRQSGSHLLIVGQSAERSLALLSITLAALAIQYPAGSAEFVVIDPHAAESGEDGWFYQLAATLPNKVHIGGPAEIAELMNSLALELATRTPTSGKGSPEVFLMVQDIQRFKALRPEDDFKFSLDDEPTVASASKVFADLLGEGGPCGMHVIVSTDTWNNVGRWIPRKLMAEFEMRVLFQMSANDSANLIDSPAASTLGLHRALFHNEHLGTLETFRPYAMPDASWLEEIRRIAHV